MATIIAIGQPVNDAERSAIAWLRDRGSTNWIVYHNFELQRGGEWFEVDLAVLTAHAVFLIDVKGTRGTIEVTQGKWYPQDGVPFASPLAKIRGHARVLKGLLKEANP